LIDCLIKLRIYGRKVISLIFKNTTSKVIIKIIQAGKAATSGQVILAKPVKTTYASHHHPINIDNCLKDKPRTIGSSFSICTGILYCTI
jgi:hypothetical protein